MHIRDPDSGANDGPRPIRFAVMNTEATFQEWQARCITNLLALPKVEIVLAIIVDENRYSRKSFIQRLASYLNRVLFELYSKYFVRPSSTRIRDVSKVLLGVPSMHCKAFKITPSLRFSGEDIQTISTYHLDFILWFGSNTIQREILKVARYGVWSFSHSAPGTTTAGLPCFWEIYTDDCSVGAMLLRLTGQDNSNIILRSGCLRVTNCSYAQTIDEVLFEIARWPARVCIDILNGNDHYVNALSSPTRASVTHVPSNFQVLRFLAKILKNRFIKVYSSFFCYDQWNIGIAYEPIDAFLKSKPKIHYLSANNKRTFLADPFGIVRDKTLTILCEEFSYSSYKGVISRIELIDENLCYQAVPALNLPGHVSYPYLIEYDGEVYCIPETASAREVGLYKADNFPEKWTKVATLITDVAAIDATVFPYEGRWWLMCTDKEQNAFVNLFAWYAPNLYGPWKPHGANPIKTDIHSARSAGTPFVHEGFLYRPAQDCSTTYGGRVVINRVTCLTPRDFKEEQAAIIEPCPDSPFPDGVHTLSTAGNITLIDGKRVIFIGTALKHKLMRRFRRMFTFQLARV